LFIDARQLPDGTHVDADLAIIGAGPAGITLARSLAGRSTQVCLIESGGFEREPDTQALYEGETVGLKYPLAGSRLRYFGGSSGHWGGYCRPLDPIDFEQRDWVPLSGWPFERSALDPYWELASEAVEVAPARFEDGAYWSDHTGEPLVHWRAGRFMTRFFQFSPPTRFGQRYRQELEQHQDVRVLLHANVTNIGSAPSARTIDHLDVRTLSGRNHSVRARRYVLAAGGIENARLLLLSNDVVAAGLGNQHDMVGRCFMEHPHMGGFAEIVIADPRRLPAIYREPVLVDGRTARVSYVPDPDYLRSKRLLSASFTMSIVGDVDTEPGEQDESAVANTTMLGAAWPFLTEQRPQAGAAHGVRMGIGCACEQVPNPESRVMLSDERDALGLRRTRLDWRLGEQDRRSLIANIRSLGREFAAAGIGRMRLRLADDSPWEAQVGGGSHHMGTTRISSDPKRGVVDANCRVHGVDNLYVAGSSVFATSGSANPTLNLVALAYRLADHLRGTAA
jgi:choline dehydrogenase-like flavoprotein